MLSPLISRPKATRAKASEAPLPANVIELHVRILPRHVALLARWLQAGRCMGLSDASAYSPGPERTSDEPATDYVLVWVRENIDPAYMITPAGTHWAVSDCVRQNTLARLRSFDAALRFIRPVLPASHAA